jgi:hypothetical protein
MKVLLPEEDNSIKLGITDFITIVSNAGEETEKDALIKDARIVSENLETRLDTIMLDVNNNILFDVENKLEGEILKEKNLEPKILQWFQTILLKH